MKICIFGAGAVGGYLAVSLARAGSDVSVVARGDQLRAVQANGLRLRIGPQSLAAAVRVSEDPASLGRQDVVIVTTKATALTEVVRRLGPLLGEQTIVVFAQNGIPWWYGQGRGDLGTLREAIATLDPEGIIHGTVAPERVVGAVVFSSNEIVEPGLIENLSPASNALVIGRPDNAASAQVTRLRAALVEAGLSSPATARIQAAVWQKLQVNLSGSTLCLLLQQPVAALAKPEMRQLFGTLMAEARSIALALGDLPSDEVAASLPKAQPNGSHKPSILIDYEANRPMELDAIVRVPMLLARALKVPCPVLETVAALATARAAGRPDPAVSAVT